MNYLAHLHLAKLTNTSFSGNLLADFCHPSLISTFPEAIQQGIAMHQFVDKTLDSHPVSVNFRAEQNIGRRRFAGIVQDLLMDYWLVRKWSIYSDISLPSFYQEFLPDLNQAKMLAGDRFQSLILSLEKNRWLESLGTLEGLQRALRSIMNRWKYGEYLMPFYDALPKLINETEAVFDRVYPDVIKSVLAHAHNKA